MNDNEEILQQAADWKDAGKGVALATVVTTWGSSPRPVGAKLGVEGDLHLDPGALAAVRTAIRDDRSTTVESPEGRLFVEVFNPPLRLIVVGAVHAAQPLARMAAIAGYSVTIVDPRSAFATEDRFPGVALSTDWPDEAMPRLKPDRRTAIVTLTHDPKID